MASPAKLTDFDLEMMARALKLARRGEGLVEPNPMVGCVVVKNGVVIGQGFHARFGGPHAEIQALRSCVASPADATVYCTLEPCAHFSKTPPCTDSLIEAEVARVVIPLLDPNPAVNGRGVRALRRAGIEVHVGALADEAATLLRPFTTRMLAGRPYVIAKWAQSLDGRLVVSPGVPCPSPVPSGAGMTKQVHGGASLGHATQWISSEASRRRVHQLRARVDAIMVGAGTVLRDDPLLTARGVPLTRSAMRWVIDGRLRIPLSSQLVKTAGSAATVVFTTAQAARSPKAMSLRRAGVEVIPCRARKGLIDLDALLHLDMFAGVTNLLVEGGPTLLSQLFRARLIDEAHVYVAPRLLGLSQKASAHGTAERVSFGPAAPTTITADRCGTDMVYKLLY